MIFFEAGHAESRIFVSLDEIKVWLGNSPQWIMLDHANEYYVLYNEAVKDKPLHWHVRNAAITGCFIVVKAAGVYGKLPKLFTLTNQDVTNIMLMVGQGRAIQSRTQIRKSAGGIAS